MQKKRIPKTNGLGQVNAARAGEILGIAEQTVRGMASRREIPFCKIGRLTFFEISDLQNFARARRVEPVGAASK